MKTIPVLLQNELESSAPRLARCMRIVRYDGEVFGFTTNRRVLEIDGESYWPGSSFVGSDIKTGSNLDTDDGQAEGILDSSYITEDDLRAGRWDYAAFQIFDVNWNSPSDGKLKLRAGRLGKVEVGALGFKVELLGRLNAYDTSIGQVTQPGCRTSLGTPLCGIVPAMVTGTIATMDTDFFTMTDLSRGEQTGFFDEGVITFTDGQAMGLRYEIKAYVLTGSPTGAVMVTKTALQYDVSGASYTLTEGCPRTWTACTVRFNNAVNYRGEPWLRGNDVLYAVGRGASA
jgi:uncharacterized phage protein (TIGR02218 family)